MVGMFRYMFVVLAFVLFVNIFGTHEDLCYSVENVNYCVVTFGCEWDPTNEWCMEQDGYYEGSGGCAGLTLLPGYICDDASMPGEYYIYDPTNADDCNKYAYIKGEGTCSSSSFGLVGVECALYPVDNALSVNDCFLDSNYINYANMAEAGICTGKTITGGCSAIPWCDWNTTSSSCGPDLNCYYFYSNGNGAGGTPVCDKNSPYNCKLDDKAPTVNFCTSDSIYSDQRACFKLGWDVSSAGGSVADQKDACLAGKCEWIEPGGSGPTAWNGLCVPEGSGTSAVRVSTLLMVLLLSVMLAFL